jgi:hypothetical protein
MRVSTPEEIADLNEFGEAEAWANYYQCAPIKFAKKFRLAAKRVGQAWVTMLPELDWNFFNRIVGLGIRETVTEALLDDCIAVLEKAGCSNFMAQISPLAQPAQLPEWLEKRGLVRKRNWAKAYRGDEPAPQVSTNLRVESIGKKYAEAYAQVALQAFEMPPELAPMLAGSIEKPGWLHYLGFDGDEPVSTAAMFVAGEVAWLGFGSTLESHRQRGGQGAMFSRRIEDGLKLGCKWFVTETGEDAPGIPNPSYHNMLRSGFKLAYLRPNYVHLNPAR